MAITKTLEEDKIEVVGQYKHVQVRTATVLKEDSKELTRSFHRHMLEPSTKKSGSWADTDISDESSEVQGICNAVWTSSVKEAYRLNLVGIRSSSL